MHNERGPVTMLKLLGNMACHIVVNFSEVLCNESLASFGQWRDASMYN